MADILSRYALDIQNAGADFLLICTNTMHKVADNIQSCINIPLLHIADATAKSLISEGIKKVALLGTAFTMEEDFYKKRLQERFDLEVIVPKKSQREMIHKIIYNELCLGIIKNSSKNYYLEVVEELAKDGAQGVILGCTEIGLLVNQNDTDIKLFDTTLLHAKEAVNIALEGIKS
jgi:aspartate racemase